jgi:hypothetical protein
MWSTYLNEKQDAGVTTLSVTESELVAAGSAAQDMLYEMRVLESISLKVQLPMVLEVWWIWLTIGVLVDALITFLSV